MSEVKIQKSDGESSVQAHSRSMGAAFESMYQEIHRIARHQLGHIPPGQTITPTILVHECFIRLQQMTRLEYNDSSHLKKISARCMRYYMVDLIRYKFRQKRHGDKVDVEVGEIIGDENIPFDLLQLDDVINRLEQIDPRLAEITEMKYFSGYTIEQLTEILGVTEHEINKRWKMAKSLMKSLLSDALG